MTTEPTAATAPSHDSDPTAPSVQSVAPVQPGQQQPAVGSVLFVCVRNSGKSQMAAGLLRRLAVDRLQVSSAGTQPGTALNELSVLAMAEVGVDLTGQHPTQLTDQLQQAAGLVVTVGGDAVVSELPGPRYQI